MKYILTILFSVALFFSFGCSTNATNSYKLAEAGQYQLSYQIIGSKAALKNAAAAALAAKGYSVTKEGSGLRAKLNHGGISANLLYTFEDDTVKVDATGSTANGRPIVPLNWILQANKNIAKNAAK